MLITLKTFNGHNLNDASYRAVLLNPHGGAMAKPVYIEQAQADAQDAGTYSVDVRNLVLTITVRSYANRNALIAQLKTWLKRGVQGALVGTFSDEGVDYQLTCRVISLVQDSDHPTQFTAILQTGETSWRAVSLTTESTWNVTGTSETQDIVAGGKDETLLSVELIGVAGPASGYIFQNLYQLPNTPGLALGFMPWCITVNTATLVTAGKMQADCDDLRIVDLNTGQELKRWIATPNNAATKVWINLNFGEGFSLALSSAVASSGAVSYLQFVVSATNSTAMGRMPASGIVYHGTEWFAYNQVDAINCRLYIAQRGLFGTSLQAHSVSDVFLYIQFPLVMKYGNASATAPSTNDANYDDTKPVFNLASSSNTSWVWTTGDKFLDPDHAIRGGQWSQGRMALGPESEVFFVKQNAETGDPAIGLKVASYQAGSVWKDENVQLSAYLSHAAGFTSVSMTGDKYRSNANWPVVDLYRYAYTSPAYMLLWREATPASEDTWTAWTHNNVSVTSVVRSAIWLLMWGGYPGAADAFAAMEILTCTVAIDTTWIPTGAFKGETTVLPLVLMIENLTTGDQVTLDYLLLVSKSFVLDGELKTAKYDGINAHSAVRLSDESRSAYVRLTGGATNQIRISGADLGEMNVVMSYYARRQ